MVFEFINVIDNVLAEVEVFEIHFKPDTDVADVIADYVSSVK
jgi:2-keto-4-pentenoate hydratase